MTLVPLATVGIAILLLHKRLAWEFIAVVTFWGLSIIVFVQSLSNNPRLLWNAGALFLSGCVFWLLLPKGKIKKQAEDKPTFDI